jgi:hypothetical protein
VQHAHRLRAAGFRGVGARAWQGSPQPGSALCLTGQHGRVPCAFRVWDIALSSRRSRASIDSIERAHPRRVHPRGRGLDFWPWRRIEAAIRRLTTKSMFES